jgi:hypothetical protein
VRAEWPQRKETLMSGSTVLVVDDEPRILEFLEENPAAR